MPLPDILAHARTVKYLSRAVQYVPPPFCDVLTYQSIGSRVLIRFTRPKTIHLMLTDPKHTAPYGMDPHSMLFLHHIPYSLLCRYRSQVQIAEGHCR